VFENGLFSASPSRLRTGWLKRVLSLGISLAANAALLVLLVAYYTPLKILDLETYARTVFIAPSLGQLYLPQVEEVTERAGVLETDAPIPAEASARPQLSEAIPDDPAPKAELVLPERVEAPPDLRERLELKPPAESRAELPPGLSFQLAPDRVPPRYNYRPDPGAINASRAVRGLIRPSLPRYSSEQSAELGSPPGSAQPARSSVTSRRVDIAEWADRAVALILENWAVPHLLPDQEEDEFEISVVVQSDGWIASTDVVSPSRVPVLQAAALKALEVSSPLPRLPRSYPEDSLEILLVFSRK
jgi:hypothetical protein